MKLWIRCRPRQAQGQRVFFFLSFSFQYSFCVVYQVIITHVCKRSMRPLVVPFSMSLYRWSISPSRKRIKEPMPESCSGLATRYLRPNQVLLTQLVNGYSLAMIPNGNFSTYLVSQPGLPSAHRTIYYVCYMVAHSPNRHETPE